MNQTSPSSYSEPPFKKMDSPKSADFVPSFMEPQLSPPVTTSKSPKDSKGGKKTNMFDPEWIDKTAVMRSSSQDKENVHGKGDGQWDEERESGEGESNGEGGRKPSVQRYMPPQRRWKQERLASGENQDLDYHDYLAKEIVRKSPRADSTSSNKEDEPQQRGRSASGGENWEDEEKMYDKAAKEWKESMRIDDAAFYKPPVSPGAGSQGGSLPKSPQSPGQWGRSPPQWQRNRSPPRRQSPPRRNSPPPRFRQQEKHKDSYQESPPTRSSYRYREEEDMDIGEQHESSGGYNSKDCGNRDSGYSRDNGYRDQHRNGVSERRISDEDGYRDREQHRNNYDSDYHHRESGSHRDSGYYRESSEVGHPRQESSGYKGRYFDGGYGRLKKEEGLKERGESEEPREKKEEEGGEWKIEG